VADSVIIPHIIGTVAILTMFFAIGPYYRDYYTSLNEEAYQVQLKQVADYMAVNLIDVVTLCQLTESDQFLVKVVEIPKQIGENLYDISLVNMASTKGDTNAIIIVTSIEKLNIFSAVDLPWSTNSSIVIYTNQTALGSFPHNVTLANNIVSNKAVSESYRWGEPWSMIVWALKEGDVIVIGFGVMDMRQEA